LRQRAELDTTRTELLTLRGYEHCQQNNVILQRGLKVSERASPPAAHCLVACPFLSFSAAGLHTEPPPHFAIDSSL